MTSRSARRSERREQLPGAGTPRPKRPGAQAQAQPPAPSKLRIAAFGLVVVAILGAGVFMAGSVFIGPREHSDVKGAISMRISMDGFDPGTLDAKPGQTLTLDWWNEDAAMHLTDGVHTLVSESLGVHYELAAQSRETVTLTAPSAPGDYDFWCDSCCGGKDNPKMHGKLHVAV